MPKFPVSPDLQAMIDWCNQPAPQFAGDTHALNFVLFIDNPPFTNLSYQGFLFFRPPVPALPRPRAFFEGTGRLRFDTRLNNETNANPNVHAPEWVKVAINLPPASNAGGVSFFNTAANGLPGTSLSQMEGDLFVDGPTSLRLGPVQFNITKTSVSL